MVQKLRDEFGGVLLQPGDDGYDAARSVWNGAIDRRPALIARCHSPVDVAAALAYAQRTGLEVAVRGGGHNYGGAAVPDDGLMIDLAGIADVTVDPATRRARCGGGATRPTRRGDTGTRAGGDRRHHQPHRGRRAHPRRRDGMADGQVRPRGGQPRLGRGGARRRACVRASADSHPELVVGVEGRRRQLRHRHRVRVPVASGRSARAPRADVLGARARLRGPARRARRDERPAPGRRRHDRCAQRPPAPFVPLCTTSLLESR